MPDPLDEKTDDDKTVTIVNYQGKTVATWTGDDGDLSPDGKILANVPDTYGEDNAEEHLVTYDARTGRVLGTRLLKPLSEDSYLIGYGWLDDDEYIVKAETTDTSSPSATTPSTSGRESRSASATSAWIPASRSPWARPAGPDNRRPVVRPVRLVRGRRTARRWPRPAWRGP